MLFVSIDALSTLLMDIFRKISDWLDLLCYVLLVSCLYISTLFILSWGVIWLIFLSPLIQARQIAFVGEIFYWVVSITSSVTLIVIYVLATRVVLLSISSVRGRQSLVSAGRDNQLDAPAGKREASVGADKYPG